MEPNENVIFLTTEEMIKFLSARQFGRLAMVLAGEPHIVPVNYAWSAAHTKLGTLYIRTAPGEKLYSAALGNSVAFEVDEIGEVEAVSVVARGVSRIVNERDEINEVEQLDLRPWVATRKGSIVAVELTELSGRRFIFGDEPDAPLEP